MVLLPAPRLHVSITYLLAPFAMTAPPRPPFTLLVVDDEPDILSAIARLFRKRYRVLVAQTVEQAQQMLQSEAIEVVLADQRLPRQSGIEFLCHIRETHPDIVRVLFTGYASIDDVINAINEGHVYRYISKPWKPQELQLLIEQAFEFHAIQKERRGLLHQLREANQQLATQNDQLSRVNQELQTLDRVRRVFMEVVSHELNTPIAIIIGYAFLLKRETPGDLGPIAQKAIDRIEAGSQRLKRISDRVFQMLALDDPTHTLHLEPVCLGTFAKDLRDELSPFLQKRAQTLLIQIDPRLAQIPYVADPLKLHDIFVHLLMNAIKFSHDSTSIELAIVPVEPHLEWLTFSVKDHGIGISLEDKDQVFGMFFSSFRSSHHSSGEFEFGKRGMGLGLSIAKHFVEMHGGTIDFQTQEGVGTTFTALLPTHPLPCGPALGQQGQPGAKNPVAK